MLERGIVSRILFPVPPPSYDVDAFPHDLIWVPKCDASGHSRGGAAPASPDDGQDHVPCLLLTYSSARFLIMFFHSNAEDLGRCHGFCCYIREQFQVHVLAVEYPGYGICPGVPCGETVMENALAAFRFVTDILQWPLDSIKVFGRSIGTGPAMGLAAKFSLAGVILVTPFLSVQELFRDRVGPLASLVEEWFANGEAAPKITSPTMIIHGQRDELIACRHGESIYELLRARKLLISPPEMEHNTNLLTNLQFFVFPMFQFFALPDYAFQDLRVPSWAFDKRRSPFYVRPCVEISSHKLPEQPGKKKLEIPAGDNGAMPLSSDANRARQEGGVPVVGKARWSPSGAVRKEVEQAVRQPQIGRDLAPLFGVEALDGADAPAPHEAAVPEETAVVTVAGMTCATKGCYDFNGATPRSGPNGTPRTLDAYRRKGFTPEAQVAIQRLEDFAGKLCAKEICSDELCVLEERMDADEELRRQEKALETLVRARQARGAHRILDARAPDLPVAPRLLAANKKDGWSSGAAAGNRVFSCGHDSVWANWCSKGTASDMLCSDLEVVDTGVQNGAIAPGLPPSIDSRDADLPTATGMPWLGRWSRRTSGEEEPTEMLVGWGGKASAEPGSGSSNRLARSLLDQDSPPMLPGSSPNDVVRGNLMRRMPNRGATRVHDRGRGATGRGGGTAAKPAVLWSACCRALPSDPLLDQASPPRGRRVASTDEHDLWEGVRQDSPFGVAALNENRATKFAI